MTTRSRSRSRDRRLVRVKREPGTSPSPSDRPRYHPEMSAKMRIKAEELRTEPIYLDSRGRPLRRGANPQLAQADHSSSTREDAPVLEIEKPNFEPSGLLAAETNNRNGVALKYTVPPESAMPRISWRLYVFKPEEGTKDKMKVLKTIHLDKQEHYLFGCDQRVADVELFHPTISKQHAVIQHRRIDGKRVVPYIIDLESTNGTFLNGERIQPSRYYELRESDLLKFGMSTREYVVLNERSA